MRLWVSSILLILSSFVFYACSGKESAVRKRIAEGVQAIRIIDSHEHLAPEATRNERELSLFTNLHYAVSDMWADGLDRKHADSLFSEPEATLEEKWELFAPYWENTRHTAYSKNLVRAFRDLYGVEDVNESTYKELSRKIQQANRPGWYREVLHVRAGIDLAICDGGLRSRKMDPSLFRGVIRFDNFLLHWNEFDYIEKTWGVKITTLADWEKALDLAFRQVKEWGFVGVKSGMADIRTLNYGKAERVEAEAIFNRLAMDKTLVDRLSWQEKKLFQDYMFSRIAENCAKYDLPLQIHTGFFYDTWHDVSQSDPTNLAPFIIRHKDTRFVLMHCSYPYGRQLLAMAKNLPNVVIDMCWAYIISPSFAAEFLNEAIETVPADKILGFGGDYSMPEGSYGHARLCREVVSGVLADKVLEGYWSEEEALGYARKILRENPIEVFKLEL